MHHILSLKLFSSSFNVITLSLDGSRKCKLDSDILITEQSTLDHYAQRTTFSAQLIDLNLVQFVSNYAVVKESLTVRKSPVIVRTVPSYSSYPNGRNYGLFCKYQLIKYKPWITKPSNAWNEEDECDLTFTNYWQSFLESETGQKLVPNWQRELENSQHYITSTDTDPLENECSVEREEWMYLAEMAKKDCDMNKTNASVQNHLNESRSHFTKEEISNYAILD